MTDKLVKRLLQENNIHIRTIQESNKSHFKINHNYFSNQNSNMAYIMGFFAADGNVSSKDNRIDLELASIDYEILEKIKEEIDLERSIKIYTCANGYIKNKLYFYSQKIKQDLIYYGIVPNKTYSSDFKFPHNLKEQYYIDYIRGYFDGDGSIGMCGYSLKFQIDSTNLSVIKDIQLTFKKQYNINLQITSEKKVNLISFRLYCYGEEVKKIYQILYTPNSLFLKRKKELFKTLVMK
jgi:DNA-binding transcriptional regulator WhiA